MVYACVGAHSYCGTDAIVLFSIVASSMGTTSGLFEMKKEPGAIIELPIGLFDVQYCGNLNILFQRLVGWERIFSLCLKSIECS